MRTQREATKLTSREQFFITLGIVLTANRKLVDEYQKLGVDPQDIHRMSGAAQIWEALMAAHPSIAALPTPDARLARVNELLGPKDTSEVLNG